MPKPPKLTSNILLLQASLQGSMGRTFSFKAPRNSALKLRGAMKFVVELFQFGVAPVADHFNGKGLDYDDDKNLSLYDNKEESRFQNKIILIWTLKFEL